MFVLDKLGIVYLKAYIHMLHPQMAYDGLPLNVFHSWNDNVLALVIISKQIR